MVDILNTIKEDGGKTGITRILYGANLSHDRLVKYIEKLKEKNLIDIVKEGDRNMYLLTGKGYRFLEEYEKIRRFAEAFGIKI